MNEAFRFLMAIISLLFLIIMDGCKKNNDVHYHPLNLVSQYHASVTGISDLSAYKTGNEFLTVSDTLARVYVISMTGDLIRMLNYSGNDLEGVTYVPLNSSIYILEEKRKEVVRLDTNGNETLRFPVKVENIFEKHGPEGITYNPYNDHLYIVTEKLPALLIEMDLTGQVYAEHELTFALDYSAVYFDPLDGSLWILSDESGIVARCDLSGNPIIRYKTGIQKGEGLFVDSGSSEIYIASELNDMLFVFSY